ncbi:MAG TPA: type II toxin-antitoxin system VapC family toxin [Candidatus Bilamarchaeaceae archaeon]|nr:type II toxin-antitoxin system VapC family toxin [Candidatus Bilamarchaeaceae archaeon]
MKIVLDTTILIDILNEQKEAIGKVEKLRETATLYTTAMNIYEVLRGVKLLERNQERYLHGLKILVQNVYVLPFNWETAEKASEIYAGLTKKGKNIDETDYMIAGCALSNGIETIVTRNERHFEEIGGLKVITY